MKANGLASRAITSELLQGVFVLGLEIKSILESYLAGVPWTWRVTSMVLDSLPFRPECCSNLGRTFLGLCRDEPLFSSPFMSDLLSTCEGPQGESRAELCFHTFFHKVCVLLKNKIM